MDESQNVSFDDYHDRGIQKWAGFYLSEHTSALNNWKKNEYAIVPQKEQQSLTVINQCLHEAILKNRQITLQKEELDLNGHYSPDLIGFIVGYDSLGIFIAGEKVGYDEIRHVEFFEFEKWSQI